jgi:MFS family permease
LLYPSIRDRSLAAVDTPAAAPRARSLWLGGNVLFLGLTSLFTDVSSEMVNAILPIYLTFELRLSPLLFGLFDGLYHGVTALLRLGGGLVADRWQHHKRVAAAGYSVSAVCKLALLAAGGAWLWTTAILLLDRLGKGVRTAPRDALISLSVPRGRLAEAFGVHRALDTAGACLGPVLAFVLLSLAPGAFDAVFVVSFCAAVVGLGLLLLFVEARAGTVSGPRVSLGAALGLLRVADFRALALLATALGLATISDAFVYLLFQRGAGLDAAFFPLLYVGTAVVYLALSVPAGRLADRLGRERVFVAGYVCLLALYVILLLPAAGTVPVLAGLALFGAYYAATDGVLMALASEIVPPHLRTSGLALLTTATALARLVAAILFGALWSWRGPEATVAVFVGALTMCTAVAMWRLAGRVPAREAV